MHFDSYITIKIFLLSACLTMIMDMVKVRSCDDHCSCWWIQNNATAIITDGM